LCNILQAKEEERERKALIRAEKRKAKEELAARRAEKRKRLEEKRQQAKTAAKPESTKDTEKSPKPQSSKSSRGCNVLVSSLITRPLLNEKSPLSLLIPTFTSSIFEDGIVEYDFDGRDDEPFILMEVSDHFFLAFS